MSDAYDTVTERERRNFHGSRLRAYPRASRESKMELDAWQSPAWARPVQTRLRNSGVTGPKFTKFLSHVELDGKYSEKVQLPAKVCSMALLTRGHFGI